MIIVIIIIIMIIIIIKTTKQNYTKLIIINQQDRKNIINIKKTNKQTMEIYKKILLSSWLWNNINLVVFLNYYIKQQNISLN